MTNRAMAQQRSRQEHHRSGALGNPPSTDGAQWRPFQIAFILLNLAGLADADIRTGSWPTCSGSRPVAARPRHTSGSSRSPSCSDGCGTRDGGGCRRPHALHAATAHAPAVPAGGRSDLRAARSMRQARSPGHGSDLDRPVGGSGRDTQQGRRARRALEQGAQAGARDLDDDGRPGPAAPCPWCGTAWTTRTTRSSTGARCAWRAVATTARSATASPSTSSTTTSTRTAPPWSSARSTSSP